MAGGVPLMLAVTGQAKPIPSMAAALVAAALGARMLAEPKPAALKLDPEQATKR